MIEYVVAWINGLFEFVIYLSAASSLCAVAVVVYSGLLLFALLDRAVVPRVSVWQVLWADMNWLSISLVTGGRAGGLGRSREDDELRPGFYSQNVQSCSHSKTTCLFVSRYSLCSLFCYVSFVSSLYSVHSAVSKAIRNQVIVHSWCGEPEWLTQLFCWVSLMTVF